MKQLTTELFIENAVAVHGDTYDYSNVEYVNNYTKVEIICKRHGSFWQTHTNHVVLKHHCPKCGIENTAMTKTNNLQHFIDKCVSVHGDKYDYSEVEYCGVKFKITIICPIHGQFIQNAGAHSRGQGCPKCGIVKRLEKTKPSNEDIVKKFIQIRGDRYDYSNVVWKSSKEKIEIICPEHGSFWQLHHNHLKGTDCPRCYSNKSKKEDVLYEYVSSLIESEQSCRDIIPPAELDIYIPSRNTAIEFNGIYWHSQLNGTPKNYHLSKTSLCRQSGIRLIHIFEDEWDFKKDIVKSRLKNILGVVHRRIYARKCIIDDISPSLKKKFLEKYHIQGDDKSSVRLGLFYRNRLVAVMTFGKNRFGREDGYELIRYCTIANFNVIGGAGKLLKHFERNWSPSRVKTYADLRWSDGNLYNQLGFTHIKNSPPNYYYIENGHRLNRIGFQKHKLKNKLKIFNPSLSEWINMQNNGFDRIWDCGNMVFEKTY